jgi:succinate-acetate transporter protein
MDSADRTETAPPLASAASAIADPGPLGLAAFALTTFMLSVFNAGIIHTAGLGAVVLPVALFYGGLAQLLAGMWEFKKNNTFGALAFTSYGAFWLSYAALAKFVAPGLPPAGVHTAVGLFLLAWTIFTVLMTIAVVKVNGALLAVFVVLTLTFICLTIGDLGSNDTLHQVGGWLGLLTAALAWYTALAGLTASTFKKSVLPVFPAK